MADPYVREIGRVEDIDGLRLVVGIRSGTVTLGFAGEARWKLPVEVADELAAMLITALWQAARQAGESSGRPVRHGRA
jgi:hypothetical protein